MVYAIKAAVNNVGVGTLRFDEQKTMYGGKHIAKGDTIFIFASENEGGRVSLDPVLSRRLKRSLRTQESLGKHRV
jgi:hypothetical protein